MYFQNPWVLLSIPVAVVVLVCVRKRRTGAAFIHSTSMSVETLGATLRTRLHGSIFILRIAALILIILAIGRPRFVVADAPKVTEGIDIVFAIDVSSTMLSEDFLREGRRQSRIEAVKDIVGEFIRKRQTDKIGIVAFASRAIMVAPFTLDYGWLLRNISRIKVGMLEDGTAVGSGIICALARLRDSKAGSRIVILLTDGRNNAGKISPLTAAEAARALGIKVYTIGAGSNGPALSPFTDIFGNRRYRRAGAGINEGILKKISERTGAAYFRATDRASLRRIYSDIDKLEKTRLKGERHRKYREGFYIFLAPGLVFLLVEIILGNTLLRKIP